MTRRRALDICCKAGGTSRGYQLAGFHVTGVDIEPQPNFAGDEFIQADAMEVLADRDFLAGFDLIAGSPPCHDHTPLRSVAGLDGTGWMLGQTRSLLMAQPVPWVLENVGAAKVRADFLLCGHMFGLRVKRHRRFEVDPRLPLLLSIPPHPRHRTKTATRDRRARWDEGWDVSITGDVGTYLAKEAMGITWMTGAELSQAIPPAYTRFIGTQLLEYLEAVAA